MHMILNKTKLKEQGKRRHHSQWLESRGKKKESRLTIYLYHYSQENEDGDHDTH